MRSYLIDSGPLIALFAVDDRHHARFDAMVKELSVGGLRLITTWPCVVEASYLLEVPQRFEMLKWIELGGVVVYPFEPVHLGDIVRWMRRYSEGGKREMDLADGDRGPNERRLIVTAVTARRYNSKSHGQSEEENPSSLRVARCPAWTDSARSDANGPG